MASANVLGAIEIGNNGLNDRQKWIVKQTEAEVRLMRSAIQDHFGVCDKTAKRDLAQLVRKGLIRYVRKPHPGYYVRNA
jgi:predicted DNA-binding transcriptional regulator